ncbi:LacI family transcriptional regulator [Pigmentiphaga sp. NML080357]|uniref:tripartite tricarboxylate transporter substrate binding protein n=1 Tax=Pigmentiphaga sp. NML080357 TaxID=2008675 RepID=UPI000B4114B5|nr:tripartite tricarboxylate transporter substrate binding protein [Pigmentiphaga sp. NML080357]OVZ59960.1 LacI family transcriptional regulator [Pigmentiphaga sp. NML080357]
MKPQFHLHRGVRRALAAAALLGAATAVQAQGNWPQAGPIRFIVPFTAGSGTDVVARSIADKLGPVLGAQIVVENKPGAGGTLGAAQVAKAPADGYTLLIHSSGHLVNPSIYPNLPYDTLKDFEGITPLASLPNVLVVAPSAGYKSLADLIAKAKAEPGKLFYASAGNGSATHMNAEQFRVAAGIEAVHVPFRGTPEAITETIAGRTTWFFAPLVSALPMIKDGKLQALAVGTSSRSAALPDVPSMTDAGLPTAAYTFWVGLFAPAKTPQPIADKIHAGVLKVLEMPDIRARLANLGAAPMPMAQDAFGKYLEDETRASARLVKAAGIRIE